MTREEEFYKDIQIAEDDIPRAAKQLISKGIEKHILIKNYLLSWRKNTQIRYSEIATTYRYDKRMRNVLFKYISYIEEHFRAVILDNLANDVVKDPIPNLKHLLGKNSNDLNIALEDLLFSDLLKQVQRFPENIREKFYPINSHEWVNINALINLRNAVMHNKFIMLYRGFKECFMKENKSATLKVNILNLTNFLPNEVSINLINEINECRKAKKNKDKTKWDLPPQIAIVLEIV